MSVRDAEQAVVCAAPMDVDTPAPALHLHARQLESNDEFGPSVSEWRSWAGHGRSSSPRKQVARPDSGKNFSEGGGSGSGILYGVFRGGEGGNQPQKRQELRSAPVRPHVDGDGVDTLRRDELIAHLIHLEFLHEEPIGIHGRHGCCADRPSPLLLCPSIIPRKPTSEFASLGVLRTGQTLVRAADRGRR